MCDIVAAAVHTAVLNEQHREAEHRYRSLVEHLPAVTYVDVAGTGQPVYVSPQLQSLMGVPAEEWVERPDGWTQRMHPDDLSVADRTASRRSRGALLRPVPADRRRRPRPLVPRRRRARARRVRRPPASCRA